MTTSTAQWLILVLVVASTMLLLWWWISAGRHRRIEAANRRLRLPIPELALTDRRLVIERLLGDPALQGHLQDTAQRENTDVAVVTGRARRYAEEMGPAFSVLFYFRLGYFLARSLLRLHYLISVVSRHDTQISDLPANTTVILVGNHRSNFDPLMITYLASKQSTVALSAGEWARLWPFHHLVRAAGGFVVDRNATDPLYRQVLGAYLRIAVAAGVHQAFFPEGELSRDGKMTVPKLGFLNYYCSALVPDRDIVFIPVGVNYDRIVEDRRLVHAPSGFKNPRRRFLIGSSLRYALSLLPLIFLRRGQRYGHACAAFGAPLSLKAWLAENEVDPEAVAGAQRKPWLPDLASELMARCGREIPVTPTALVARVLCDDPDRTLWQHSDLRADAAQMVKQLTAANAHVHLPGGLDASLDSALQILRGNRLIHSTDIDQFSVAESERPVLRHYANSIAHLVVT